MTLLDSLPVRNQAQEELRAWAEVPDDLVDIGAAALALAALRHPQRDLLLYRESLDRLAAEVAELVRTVKPSKVEQIAALLREVIAVRHRYEGDVATFDAPENANLIKVMDRRRGLPVALGILYLSVARANGWAAVGLSFPEYFLIRLEFNGRRIILDPFARGEVVAVPRLRALVKERLGERAELKPDYYMPMTNREVLLRLQNNLKLRFSRAGMDEATAEVLESMLLVDPAQPNLWREYGLMLARMGEEHRAIIAFENYLVLSQDDPLRHQTASLLEQLKKLTATFGG